MNTVDVKESEVHKKLIGLKDIGVENTICDIETYKKEPEVPVNNNLDTS